MKDTRCTDCWEEYPATPKYFYRNKSRNNGLNNICKECSSLRSKGAYKKKDPNEYALYKGEEILGIGTMEEIAEKLNVKYQTINHYGTPAYKRRTSEENGRRLIRIN